MPTDLFFFAVKQAFWLNSYLYKTPVGWDSSQNKFTFDSCSPWKFFWWYFCIFVIFFGLLGSSCVYVIYGQLTHQRPELPIGHVVNYFLVIICGVLAAAIALVVWGTGEDAIKMINGFLEVQAGLEDASKDFRVVRTQNYDGVDGYLESIGRKMGIPRIHKSDGTLDKLGLSCLIGFVVVSFLAHVSTLPLLLAKMDVLNFVLVDIWNLFGIRDNSVVQIIDFVIRIPPTYIFYMEIQRTFPFLIYFFGIPAQSSLRSIAICMEHAVLVGENVHRVQRSWLYPFQKMRILYLVTDLMPTQAFLLMAIGLQACVATLFATIRFLDYGLNPVYYAVFPSAAVATILIIQGILPIAIKTCMSSNEVLVMWRAATAKVDTRNKFIRKSLEAQRPIAIHAGLGKINFFKLDETVLGTFYEAVQDWTITMLMTYPAGKGHN